MQKFETFSGIVVPLNRANVDTDAIIPKQFLKSIKRTGFGPNLFDEWRYLDRGDVGMDNSQRPINPEFVLNFPQYQGAEVLLTRENFGCGSSREHAPWAVQEYGFKVVIAPSFADIFFNNCFKIGLLPVVLPADVVEKLFQQEAATPGYRLTINLAEQAVITPAGERFAFEITEHRKHCLLNGLDEIGLTLEQSADIRAYEVQRRTAAPWLFA